MTKQPRDDGNAPIPVLGLIPNGGHIIDLTGGGSQRSAAFSPSVRVITVYATADCFIEIGDDTVVANTSNSHFLPSQFLCDFSLGFDNIATKNSKYLAVYGLDVGKVYISERL